MATSAMRLTLSRSKLATFLKTPELIRAFEELVATVDETLPTDFNDRADAVELTVAAVEGRVEALAAIVQAAAEAGAMSALAPRHEPTSAEPSHEPARLAQLEAQVAELLRRVADLESAP
jgi:hypothetical protein